MSNSYKLIEEGRKDELWNKHCGYLSLSRKEFRNIQMRLMLEQINLLKNSTIGNVFFEGKTPESVDEYRKIAPLTTYDNYSDLLKEKKEEGLPDKPFVWARTSGKSSALGPKWIPYTKAMYNRLSDPGTAAMIMSSCSQPGDVRLERNDKFLMATAPPPYLTGHIARSVQENLEVRFLPGLDEGEKMEYKERVALGFKLAMHEGLDYFFGLSVVLARMGEQFEQQTSNSTPSKEILDLPTLWRLLDRKSVV
jgi:hypothetical protein